MIDITPYLNKLTILQEWIDLKVDKRLPVRPIYEGKAPKVGIAGNGVYAWFSRPMTFEEYYQHKTQVA